VQDKVSSLDKDWHSTDFANDDYDDDDDDDPVVCVAFETGHQLHTEF